MELSQIISTEFNKKINHIENIITLIDEGNTIPFIARYRKELTGSCDDQVLREIFDRLRFLRNLDERKNQIIDIITEQGNMTEELLASLNNASKLTELEDLYRPFKPKRKTRASVAKEKGLEPLANIIFAQELSSEEILQKATEFVDSEKGVDNKDDALKGAFDIVAELIADDANNRKRLRNYVSLNAMIVTKANKPDEKDTYSMYANFSERVDKIVSHRILAINRGEKEDCIKVKLEYNQNRCEEITASIFVKNESANAEMIKEIIADALDRLVLPSIEREVRSELSENANEQAIKTFETNLFPLLLQPPLKGKVILGLDPAYRTGCKIAVISSSGAVLDTTVIYPTPPQSKVDEAEQKLLGLIKKHNVDIISIGNGTASKESEIFVVELIKKSSRPLQYIVVSESGASVYSASKLAAEEFPNFDVSLRSAVSIARRLLDPLAELIKIDVKALGVGQYQHDMPQKRLGEVLDGVVEDSVNKIGADINTASVALLTHISGLSKAIAKAIVDYREKNGNIESREQLKKIKRINEKVFSQCAGFLRVTDANIDVLDMTAVHPESYVACRKLMEIFNITDDNIKNNELSTLLSAVENYGKTKLCEQIGIGAETLDDITAELIKPARDIREDLPKPILRGELLSIKDLTPDMVITGTVRNVVDFGVFVDIGVHQDGLVHISQICNDYIKHPSEVLKVGDIVNAKVMSVDADRNKISLTLKDVEV